MRACVCACVRACEGGEHLHEALRKGHHVAAAAEDTVQQHRCGRLLALRGAPREFHQRALDHLVPLRRPHPAASPPISFSNRSCLRRVVRPHSYRSNGTAQPMTVGTACTDEILCCETISCLRSCLDGSRGAAAGLVFGWVLTGPHRSSCRMENAAAAISSEMQSGTAYLDRHVWEVASTPNATCRLWWRCVVTKTALPSAQEHMPFRQLNIHC